MDYSARRIGLLAAGGSAALLLGAFAFQLMGYAPCAMCLWQRYPHAAAVAVGVLLLAVLRLPVLYLAGALAAAATGAIGVYHTGVERGWWEGPSSCTGTGLDLSSMTGESLLSTENVPPVVLCDEVVWQFLGLSMASWNALASFGLAALWVAAYRMARRAPMPQPA